MTPISTPPPSPLPLHLHQRPDLPTVHRLISSLNSCIVSFLSDHSARNALQCRCKAKLSITNVRDFEFFEHSVVSNLYWGMENIELAIQSGSAEEKERRLANAERMLQAPASLDEEGTVAGVLNWYLVCSAYFYLSAVRSLRGDDWQAAMHLLHCLLVSPRWCREELEVEPWMGLFRTVASEGNEEAKDEILRQNARRCKDWLMYYQIVYYGDNPSSLVKGSRNFLSSRCFDSAKEASPWTMSLDAKFVYQLDLQECAKGDNFAQLDNGKALLKDFNDSLLPDIKETFDMRCLQQMLEDSQSDTTISNSHIDPMEPTDFEERLQFEESFAETLSSNADLLASKTDDRNAHGCRNSPMHHEANEVNESFVVSNALHGSLNTVSFPVLSLRDVDSHHFSKCYAKDMMHAGQSPAREIRCFSSFSSKFLKRCSLPEYVPRASFARRRINFTNSEKDLSDESSSYEKDTQVELLGRFEKAVAMLCFSESKCEDAGLEVTTVWEILNNKSEVNYRPLKQVILHQLLEIISTSKSDNFIRASVSTLLVLVSEDETVIEDIRKKEQHLYDLASALKRNIHEAAILIYLLNPSPSEIKSLELLPALVEVACNSNSEKCSSKALQLTPTSASILMIESLVTAFDYVTNNMNLTLISSPQTLSKLVTVAKSKNLDAIVALAAILVRCLHLDGNCRKYLAQVPPLIPFLNLLNSNEKRAKLAALEYFYELLRMPRSSAIHLLHRIHQHGMINFIQTLVACMQQAELEHQLMAANLLLQLDMMGRTGCKSKYREEAMGVLLKAVASEENPNSQALSASILSNLGGTYSWTGESHTAAWLLRKAGLTSVPQRNMIRNIDWSDPCLQENELDAWNAKVARSVIRLGSCVFDALKKGIESKMRGVARDCLISIAWLGSEMAANGPSSLRYSACEILLSKIADFLHPGSELDERILACLCVYKYTSGKGKQKLTNFSEGSRESLRRLSSITWMAEELLKVTDYFLPTKSRISCVHTQILEIGHVCNVAATALIFYKGHLCSGYADGSIKVWDIKGQRAMLVWEMKEHKKPVTCFAIDGEGDKLLSGSSDRTIRVWKMEQKKLECVEVLQLKEPVLKMDTHGDKILLVTQKSGLKVRHASSSSMQIVCKNRQIKCLAVAQNKVYIGCADSSMQEVDIKENHKIEIRAPTNSWRMLNKPINSVTVYKDWIYCAGTSVEGSSMKEWRRKSKPQLSIATGRGTSVQAMAVVEDFIYLNYTSSPTIIQIWLREKQQKVSRLSAGSKITCLLAANDVVFCGTESGLIKGWIPL